MSWVGKKVVCIDNEEDPTDLLCEGEIYTVVSETYGSKDGKHRFHLAETNKKHFADRFELLVPDEEPTKASEVPTLSPPKPTEDQEEVRLRSIFTKPHPGHCPCGLLKESCEYHRDSIFPTFKQAIADWDSL